MNFLPTWLRAIFCRHQWAYRVASFCPPLDLVEYVGFGNPDRFLYGTTRILCECRRCGKLSERWIRGKASVLETDS